MQYKKLFAYSVSASAYLLIGKNLSGQALYTDLTPDSVWEPLETWFYTYDDILFIDMDHDGVNDFKFLNLSYTFDYTFSTPDVFRQRVWAGNVEWDDLYENFLAASAMTYWTISGSIKRAYPYPLLAGSPISASLNWFGGRFQFMASYYTYNRLNSLGDTIHVSSSRGNWLDNVEDRYIGVKFRSDLDNATHYGWIRCSVFDNLDEGFELVVKDYAYETKANTAIAAGDTIGDTTTHVIFMGNSDLSFEGSFNVYSFGKLIHIAVSNEAILPAEISVQSLTGDLICNKDLQTTTKIIDIQNAAAGIYIIKIISGSNTYMKKLWVE